MTWNHIDSARLGDNVLDLYERGGNHMVRIDGLELMSGDWHNSEDTLGELAVRLARVEEPHVLIGGLGLGYTLVSAMRTLQGKGCITVGEISPAIIDWYHRFVSGKVLPSYVTIERSDITHILKSGRRFDVIALDVDNGPEALVQPSNAFLYTVEGMETSRAALAEKGVLIVWSSFESPEFLRVAEQAGFKVFVAPTRFYNRRDSWHYIYAMSETPFSIPEMDVLAEGHEDLHPHVMGVT